MEKYTSFSLDNNLVCIDSWSFIDIEVLDLIMQKGFYPYKQMCDIEKVDETLSSKNEFYSLSSGKGISDK